MAVFLLQWQNTGVVRQSCSTKYMTILLERHWKVLNLHLNQSTYPPPSSFCLPMANRSSKAIKQWEFEHSSCVYVGLVYQSWTELGILFYWLFGLYGRMMYVSSENLYICLLWEKYWQWNVFSVLFSCLSKLSVICTCSCFSWCQWHERGIQFDRAFHFACLVCFQLINSASNKRWITECNTEAPWISRHN